MCAIGVPNLRFGHKLKKKTKNKKKNKLIHSKIKPLMISFRIYFDNSKTNIMKF